METLAILILVFFTIKHGGAEPNNVYQEVRVGLVVEFGSAEGKILKNSFSLALSDFYRINNGYRTRVSVLARDSRGDPLLSLAAATDLIKKTKVEAIVGAQSLLEAKLLAAVSEKAKVPVVSALAPSSLSLKKYNHFLQLTHDSTSEAKGISRLIHDFNWESIVVIYEEGVDDWREGLQILLEHFQDDGIHIDRTVSFAESREDYTVMNQLRKLIKSSRSAVFVVHMSETLVSRLFRCAEKLGMMEGGYAWILTARTMNKFYHSDHRSMQGVIGFRSYIPESEELTNYTSRLKKLMVGDDDENAKMETKLTSVCAHDIAFILAKSIEKIGRLRESSHLSPSDLLEEIKKSIFKGLSHADIGHKFLSGSGIFEIVNMVGTGERRIGLWSCDHFVGRRNIMASSVNELETIIWPGGSSRIPGHRFLAENGGRKRLRVLVTSNNRFPHLVAVRHDPETGFSTVTGFSIEVFKTCIASFNYELEFIPYDGDNYDKLAFELSTQRDKYDAAVGDISITSNRSLYVDFTSPYTDMGFGALELKKKRESMWTFFDPFDISLWLTSGAFFILTGFVVWLVERAVNPEFQGTWGQQLGMILWFGFSTLVLPHGEKLQKMSSRFLVIVWVFVVLILTSSYSANLTSTKTISRIQISQLVSPEKVEVYRRNILYNFEDNAQALRNGTISYVAAETPYLLVLLGQYPGVFNMIVKESGGNGFGFMFQRGSGLVANVSREIIKLRSSGMLKDKEKRWFQKMDSFTLNPNTDTSENDDASKRLTIQELGGLFIIAGVAHALVLVVHLFHTRGEILRVLWESRLFLKLQSFSCLDK